MGGSSPSAVAIRGMPIGEGCYPEIALSDASAWICDVAPWAARTSAPEREALGSGQVVVSEEDARARALPSVAFAFDLTGSGLRAVWRDRHLAVAQERPPGPLRIVIEAFRSDDLAAAQLEELVSRRVLDAWEASLEPVGRVVCSAKEDFAWIALADVQCHAVRVKWQRGLWTVVVMVPVPGGSEALLVSFTTPSFDPSAHLAVRRFMDTFCFGAEPRATLRPRLEWDDAEGEHEILLTPGGGDMMLGGSQACHIVVHSPCAHAHHASLRFRDGQWLLVPGPMADAVTTVNGAACALPETMLWDRDEIRLEGEGGHQRLVYRDEVFHRSALEAGDPLGEIEPPLATAPRPRIVIEQTGTHRHQVIELDERMVYWIDSPHDGQIRIRNDPFTQYLATLRYERGRWHVSIERGARATINDRVVPRDGIPMCHDDRLQLEAFGDRWLLVFRDERQPRRGHALPSAAAQNRGRGLLGQVARLLSRKRSQ